MTVFSIYYDQGKQALQQKSLLQNWPSLMEICALKAKRFGSKKIKEINRCCIVVNVFLRNFETIRPSCLG